MTSEQTQRTRPTDLPPVPQWRLPRQAAAPEGPVDVRMMYVMHHGFRRDLEMFAAAAAATPAEDRDTWSALERRWAVFSLVLHHHHAGEDAGLWPRLLEVAEPGERATLEAMEAEHEQIDPLLAECARGFARMRETADAGTAAWLAARLAEARDGLGEHLRHEETDAMALVQKYLTTEDWHALEEAEFRPRTSFSELLAAVPWIGHELPPDARDALLSEAGLPMRLIWLLTRRRFARLDARATRHLRV